MKKLFLTLALCWAAAAALAEPVRYDYEIIAERDHSRQLFTQGLVLHEGIFYESSGLYGRSRLVSYARNPGEQAEARRTFLHNRSLPRRYFAEGLAHWDDKLYLLTWRENTLLVFDRDTFEPLEEHRYRGEGWGLTHNGEHFIRSDGSHRLYFHGRDEFRLERTLEVREGGAPVERLNELEYLDGRVWANIWRENRLVEIDLANGEVVGYLDLTALVEKMAMRDPDSVLNGVTWDSRAGALWVTGKNWPRLFLLQLTRPD